MNKKQLRKRGEEAGVTATEQWIQFAKDNWWILLAALAALWIVISLVRTVIKWLLVAAIVGVVLVYGANYTDQLKTMSDQMLAEAKEKAFRVILDRALKAEYESGENGAYAVYTDSLRLEGTEGSDEVTLYWNGVKIGTIPIDADIEAFLNRARQNE